MDATETTKFSGYDRFVLVRPRICNACQHGFERKPSRAGATLMVALGALGILIGAGILTGGPVPLWLAVQGVGFSPNKRIQLGLGSAGMVFVGIWWMRRSFTVLSRYRVLRANQP